MSNFGYRQVPIIDRLPVATAKELQVMLRAVRQAGRVVRARYTTSHRVYEKGVGDLVSELDVACDHIITRQLQRHYPGDAILSEELSPDTPAQVGSCWVVDPLDATSALVFAVSPDMPSIMVARLHNGACGVAVVYFPLTNETFYAIRGKGAYQGAQRLRVQATPLAESWIELNQYGDARQESALFGRLRQNLRQPGGARLVSSSPPHSGAGVRMAQGHKKLAAIVHDNNATKIKQAPWDVLPVALIVHEAGGVVVNFGGQAYDPFKPEPFIMATSRALAQEIIHKS